MQLSRSQLVNKSIRLAFREPRLWGYGALMMALGSLLGWLFPPTKSYALLSAATLATLAEQLCRAALLVALSHQCLAVVRGQRPAVHEAFVSARRNWQAVLAFGVLLWGINELLLRITTQSALSATTQDLDSAARGLGLTGLLLLFVMSAYMVLPVLARESVGPVGAARRTWQILGRVWRPRLRGLLSITALFVAPVVVVVLGAVVVKVLVWPAFELPAYATQLLQIPMIFFFAIFIAADQLFDVGVYLAATEGEPAREADATP